MPPKSPVDQQTRELQVTLPLQVYVLLSRLTTKRTEQGYAPAKSTKTALVIEAIKGLALKEGLYFPPQLAQDLDEPAAGTGTNGGDQ